MSQKTLETEEEVPVGVQMSEERQRGSPAPSEGGESQKSEGENPVATGESQLELVCYYTFHTLHKS